MAYIKYVIKKIESKLTSFFEFCFIIFLSKPQQSVMFLLLTVLKTQDRKQNLQ